MGLSSLKHTGLLDTEVNGDWHAESSTNGIYLFIFYLVDSSMNVSLRKAFHTACVQILQIIGKV